MDYIINYKKWNALFEQDDLSTKQITPPVKKLSQTDGSDLKSHGVSSKLDYVNTTKLGEGPGKEVFIEHKEEMWVIIYGQLIGHSGFDKVSGAGDKETGKNYVSYWVIDSPNVYYPYYGHFKNLKLPQEWVDQSRKLFNERFWKAFNEKVKQPEWVKYVVTQFNNLFGSSQDKRSETVESIQGYIKSKLDADPKLKGYVINNGTVGREFVDGVWGPVSATAWLIFAKKLVTPSDTIGSATYNFCKTRSTNITTPGVPIDSIITNKLSEPSPSAQKTVTPEKTDVNKKPATSTGGPNPSKFGKANTL